MLPHRTTTLSGLLLALESNFLDHVDDIEQWLRSQWLESTPPFYGSTDRRNAGFTLAPVDLNLFSGRFNNPGNAFIPLHAGWHSRRKPSHAHDWHGFLP